MNTVEKICRRIDETEVLDMLQEECAELIQAASKCKRVIKGDDSVNPRDARESLVEEMADVQVMRTIVLCKILTPEEWDKVCATIGDKTGRYLERINRRTANE